MRLRLPVLPSSSVRTHGKKPKTARTLFLQILLYVGQTSRLAKLTVCLARYLVTRGDFWPLRIPRSLSSSKLMCRSTEILSCAISSVNLPEHWKRSWV